MEMDLCVYDGVNHPSIFLMLDHLSSCCCSPSLEKEEDKKNCFLKKMKKRVRLALYWAHILLNNNL